jgi:hypothetical protein
MVVVVFIGCMISYLRDGNAGHQLPVVDMWFLPGSDLNAKPKNTKKKKQCVRCRAGFLFGVISIVFDF